MPGSFGSKRTVDILYRFENACSECFISYAISSSSLHYYYFFSFFFAYTTAHRPGLLVLQRPYLFCNLELAVADGMLLTAPTEALAPGALAEKGHNADQILVNPQRYIIENRVCMCPFAVFFLPFFCCLFIVYLLFFCSSCILYLVLLFLFVLVICFCFHLLAMELYHFFTRTN